MKSHIRSGFRIHNVEYQKEECMSKAVAGVRRKKVRGEAYELISMIAIFCAQAIKHRNTRFFRLPGTTGHLCKDKEHLSFTKKCFAHDKDLKTLADNYEVFLRVIEKVATRKYGKRVQGEAVELISIMAILCAHAIEHRCTRFYRSPGTIVDVFKDKAFFNWIKESCSRDEDLRILANNFEVFLRVIERVATRK